MKIKVLLFIFLLSSLLYASDNPLGFIDRSGKCYYAFYDKMENVTKVYKNGNVEFTYKNSKPVRFEYVQYKEFFILLYNLETKKYDLYIKDLPIVSFSGNVIIRELISDFHGNCYYALETGTGTDNNKLYIYRNDYLVLEVQLEEKMVFGSLNRDSVDNAYTMIIDKSSNQVFIYRNEFLENTFYY